MSIWIRSLLFAATVFHTVVGKVSCYSYSNNYYIATESKFENGGYYDSNGRYYERSEPYYTTFGELVTRGGKYDSNKTYVPTEYEYNNGGYYINDYATYIPYGSYNSTGYFTPTDSYYKSMDYYDSNGRYYPHRDEESYYGSKDSYNYIDTPTPHLSPYHDVVAYPEPYTDEPMPYPYPDEPMPYLYPDEPMPYPYTDEPMPYPYTDEPMPYPYTDEPMPYPYTDEPMPYPYTDEPMPYPYTDEPMPYPYPDEPMPYPYTDEPMYDNCEGYYNTYGSYISCGGTYSYGDYVPTEKEYNHGGYKNSRGYYIPRGYYNSEPYYGYYRSESDYDGSDYNGSDYDGSDYDGSNEPYEPYEYEYTYDDSYELYGTIESGECGRHNTAESEFQQSVGKCLNNAGRFEDQAQGYLDRLTTEVKQNPNCKYIQAVIDSDDTNVAQEFKDLFDQLGNLNDPVDALEWLQNVPEQSYVNVCAEIAQFQSCIADGLLPIISEAIDIVESDQCCTEFMDKISIEGYSIVERIEMLVNQVPNLFCLNRIPDESIPTEQNCGYTIVQSMFPPVFDEIAANLKQLVQIPNDQACKAFNGELYTDTNGKKNYLTINLPIGSCSSAFDTIFSTAKAFLIDDGENSLYDFVIDSGLISRRSLDDLEREIGPLTALFDDESCTNIELPDGFGDICLNFPTEFTRECYPKLASKGVYGGPMTGLFGESNQVDGGNDDGKRDGGNDDGESDGGNDDGEGDGGNENGDGDGGNVNGEGDGGNENGDGDGGNVNGNNGIAGQSASVVVTIVSIVFINISWMYFN